MTVYHKEKYKERSGYKGNEDSYQVVSSGGDILKAGLSAKAANRLLKLIRLLNTVDASLRSYNLKTGDIN